MVVVCKDGHSNRVGSPVNKLSFTAPLVGTQLDEQTSRSKWYYSAITSLFVILGTFYLFYSISITGSNFLDSRLKIGSLSSDWMMSLGLKGGAYWDEITGKKSNHKGWSDYLSDMEDYLNKTRSDSSYQVKKRPLNPLLVATFSHIPPNDSHFFSDLLPYELMHWADVHWTLAFHRFSQLRGDMEGRKSSELSSDQSMLERYIKYKANAELVYAHNKKSIKYAGEEGEVDYLYTLELNKFADFNGEDLVYYGYVDGIKRNQLAYNRSMDFDAWNKVDLSLDELEGAFWKKDTPEAFDWRKEGCVQEVKNQMHCGSCWAFSAVESLESAICLARKKHDGSLVRETGPVAPDDDNSGGHKGWKVSESMPNLSEQQLVDCSKDQGNHGCSGGMMEFAFQYMMDNGHHGLCETSSYQYSATEGDCLEQNCVYEPDWNVIGWNNVSRFSNSSLKKAIYSYGTIAVSVEADKPMFMLYKGGVVHDGTVGDNSDEQICGVQLDHGVAAVGWGTDDESKESYWIVKNSWGPKWGEDGFIRISRKSGGIYGECGILMDGSYPIIKITE